MDAENRALCKLYSDTTDLGWRKIALKVVKKNKRHPSHTAVKQVVENWEVSKDGPGPGRPKGTRETTKAEDKLIVRTMVNIRGKHTGGDVTINDIKVRLPANLRELSNELLRLRLHEAGYAKETKVDKEAPTEKNRKQRMDFCHENKHRSARDWLSYLQCVGDLKWFGWYPRKLQARHQRYRCKKTWLKKSEKYKPGMLRPKEWYTKKEWKLVKKIKLLGFTCSNGTTWSCVCPTPWNNEKFATIIRDHFGPWLHRQFPGRRQYRVLLDGEKLLHAPAPTRAFEEMRMVCLSNWPARSPDLNPQENLWSWTEKELRKAEPIGESYEAFLDRLLDVHCKVPAFMCLNLISSMERRMKLLEEAKGGPIRY